MMNPLINLSVALGLLSLAAWLFMPERGLVARWRRSRQNLLRVWMEDALKALYNCEYKGTYCDLGGLAGRMGVSQDKVLHVLQKLREQSLVKIEGERVLLTRLGRSYALRIIRIHRIWESYLADETGMAETEWHRQADLREHELSMEEVNALAGKLGNPVFDPHGDPIPSAKGELPGPKGMPLRDLPEGKEGIIIHLEDEPPEVYAQLVAMGLYPGLVVRMIEKDDKRLRFEAHEEELLLAPLLSSNVTVRPVEEEDRVSKTGLRLLEIPLGEEVEIAGISGTCRGQQRRRLMDLGIVRGNHIRPLFRAPGGDPTAYEVLGANIALREEQAKHIFVKRLSSTEKQKKHGAQ